MILTKSLIEKKATMKFNDTGVYIFRNKLLHQIGYYAVDKIEFDLLEKAVSPYNLTGCYIYVYELDIQDERMFLKFDSNGNKINLGKRRVGDLEKLAIGSDGVLKL